MAGLLGLPSELLTGVCQHLCLLDLARFAASCRLLRYGHLPMVEPPGESPVATVLRKLSFRDGESVPHSLPTGSSESWVAYLARCVRQRRCREASPIAARHWHNLFVDAAGRSLACGRDVAKGHDGRHGCCAEPIPVAALAGIPVRSVAAGPQYNLALGWDGQVYSWGSNCFGQLGHGDNKERLLPALVQGLQDICAIAAADQHSLAVTQSGDVLSWGRMFPYRQHLFDNVRFEGTKTPTIVEGFGGVRVRHVFAGENAAFAIGEKGELFSWGDGIHGCLGHGDTQAQPSPKRVEALRGVRVVSVSMGHAQGYSHAIMLAEDGLVYTCGGNRAQEVLGNPHVEIELVPKPVEALRGVRVSSVAAAGERSYALAGTGELWVWGSDDRQGSPPLGHGEPMNCPLPKQLEALRGIKVDAIAAGDFHTLALADDGSVHAWGDKFSAQIGALCSPHAMEHEYEMRTPQRVPMLLRAACGL
eukprot:scaffold10205_cov112-Isochrysis_galbana.AAC.1